MPVSADAESRVVVAMCTAAAGSPAAVYRTFCLFHRMSRVAGLATSQCGYHCGHLPSFAKLRGLRVRTRDCHCGPDLSGPRTREAVTVAVSADSGPCVTTHTCVTIRGAPTRSRISAASQAAQATQLVSQATADCPPLRSADCAPLSGELTVQIAGDAGLGSAAVRACAAHQTPDPAATSLFRIPVRA